jgi:hypothetical protein
MFAPPPEMVRLYMVTALETFNAGGRAYISDTKMWNEIYEGLENIPAFSFEEDLVHVGEYETFGLRLMTEGMPILPFPKCFFMVEQGQSYAVMETMEPDHALSIVLINGAEKTAPVPAISVFMKDVRPIEGKPNEYEWKAYGSVLSARSKSDANVMRERADSPEGLKATTIISEVVVGLAAALLSKDTVKHPGTTVSPRIQKKRARRGQPPINNPTIVRLSATAAQARNAGAGTGRSPRPHYRRGHIRTLAHNGVRVPVAPCIVNADDKSEIQAKYKVKA